MLSGENLVSRTSSGKENCLFKFDWLNRLIENLQFKAASRNFLVVLILAPPVDRSGMSATLIWLVSEFVEGRGERKTFPLFFKTHLQEVLFVTLKEQFNSFIVSYSTKHFRSFTVKSAAGELF